MRYKNLIFILLILTLIVLVACEKKKEITPIATKELNVTPKEQPKQDNQIKPPEKINPEDLPWNDCAKSFNRDELLDICKLDLGIAEYYESSKACQIILKSNNINNNKVFIEIEEHLNINDAREKYDFVIQTSGKKNNATIIGNSAKWQEHINGVSIDRVETYKDKKEIEIRATGGACKDFNKLTQKVFALV